ncbi:hypothetical protein BD410DRAFT_779557 [Rickenella mellea]|uniref:Uncharacterized protein n=1 Tax=Rickenella mellea TaxID=50990 RepID=A0A4R5XF85_9AGAM|nr:hypothetical protein BD410DRAFT_779557 [Rickenella mellea]
MKLTRSSANDVENQREPLLRANQPSYSPIPTPQAIAKPEISKDRSALSWKIALMIFGLLLFGAVIVHSAIDHRTPQERERARWELEREREAHNKEHEQWERDRFERNREIEQRRKEEEERKKATEKSNYRNSGMHWGEPRPLRRVEYGIREYTTRLLDVPFAYDRRKGCEYIPVTINGFTFETPTYCDDQGLGSGVFGHWQLLNQTICMPYWDKWFKDVGCSGLGSGKRRLEARLLDLQNGDDRNRMCETTPAIIHGVHYPSPIHCHDYGIRSGMYGIWDIDDPKCLY